MKNGDLSPFCTNNSIFKNTFGILYRIFKFTKYLSKVRTLSDVLCKANFQNQVGAYPRTQRLRPNLKD